MRRARMGITIALAAVLVAAGCNKNFLTTHPVAVAGATLADSAGRNIGTARLWQEASGLVHVDVDITCAGVSCTPLAPGEHGIHFHSVGSCVSASSPVFSSAGGHFNPLGKQHGLSNAAGPHAGDAPNLVIGADGRGTARFTTDRITLTAGPTSVFDADGTSIVIHAGPDDQTSQPAGNSGARVACGVLKTVQ
jgi:superoxide dismutase, Cu-Zn family